MDQMLIAERLSSSLERFDRIFAIMDQEEDTGGNLAYDFCSSKALQETAKRILILSDKDIPGIKDWNHQFQRLHEKEMDMIRRIYFMYEFSDRFQILSYNPQYGSLLNYVKSGDMTMEAVFQSLLEA